MNQQLNRSQICELLNCKSKKFYNLIADKNDPLPAYKLGEGPRAEWRIDPVMLEEWIKRQVENGTMMSRELPQMTRPQMQKRWEMIIPKKTALHS